MKRRGISLFRKFSMAIVTVVLLFGAINVFVVWDHVRAAMSLELDQHAISIANRSSRAAETLLLYDDIVGLQTLVDDLMELDTTLAYAFVQGEDGRIVVHSFERGVPFGIIQANRLAEDASLSRILITPNDGSLPQILDIAVPIIDASVGTMRIGLREDLIAETSSTLLNILIVMSTIFLGLGLVGAFVFSHVITRPMAAMSEVATEIARLPADARGFPRIDMRNWPSLSRRIHMQWPDEMDYLVLDLNMMISRWEEALTQLRRTRASLVQSEKLASVGTLAAGIAHEINNPLAGLQNCVRRIQRYPEQTEKNARYLQLIAQAAEQIQHVVQGLLDFTRKQSFEPAILDVATLFSDIVPLVEFRLQSDRIEMVQQLDAQLPAIMGSRNHLQQVLLNLVVNSTDAIEARCEREVEHLGQLFLGARTVGSMIQIIVRDNGTGIPSQHLSSVFDPFFTTKDVGKGTGLGLAVSYNLVTEHGGRIWVESEEGRYTEFTIELPIHMPGTPS